MASSTAAATVPNAGPSERGLLIFKAKVAEQAERYDDMATFMRKCAEMDPQLSTEEKNLLSIAYKNAVGSRRSSCRVLTAIEERQTEGNNIKFAEMAKGYRKTVEEELMKVCEDILGLLEKHLVPAALTPDSQVFFYKMRGDYYRYIAEFATEKKVPAAHAKEAYEEAYKIAIEKLQPTHPICLGLALNYSVFHYEIMGDPQSACQMAQKAFDDAIRELDSVSEENYNDSTLIMQLLRDNLTLWTAEPAENDSDRDDEKVKGAAAAGKGAAAAGADVPAAADNAAA